MASKKSKALVVLDKSHATLGASSAHRWMNCPGSVRLERDLPDVTSDAAEEGTTAHALAELALRRGFPLDTYIGTEINDEIITEEMVGYLEHYVAYVRDLIPRCNPYRIELPINLASLKPPEPMFGTPDFVGYDASEKTLHVVDLKYGKGHIVEVRGNVQTRYYALGACLNFGANLDIERVTMTIVQPRAYHIDGVVRSETIGYDEVQSFATTLLDAARATQAPDAPLVVGSWCTFCKAQPICPAKHQHAMEVAQSEFSVIEEVVPPPPEALTMPQLLDIVRHTDALRSWLTAVENYVHARLLNGESVPGYKLVESGRTHRRWTDEEEAQAAVEALEVDDAYEPARLKSPAQIEKLVGKREFRDKLAPMTRKPIGRLIVVPESDPRPAALLDAATEFTALPGYVPESDE